MNRLRRGPLPKPYLQQTLSRDFQAKMFHHIVNRLVADGYLLLHDGNLYLTRAGALAIGCENVPMSRIPSTQGFVEFAGKTCDPSSGMPRPYLKYWITANPGPAADSGIVTITPLTRMAPLLESSAFLVPRGGPQAAFLEAVGRLTALPQNAGLVCRVLAP